MNTSGTRILAHEFWAWATRDPGESFELGEKSMLIHWIEQDREYDVEIDLEDFKSTIAAMRGALKDSLDVDVVWAALSRRISAAVSKDGSRASRFRLDQESSLFVPVDAGSPSSDRLRLGPSDLHVAPVRSRKAL